MTNRSKLLALADAVEKLTGSNHGMDVAIHTAMAATGWQSTGNALDFTASLDAAMTLISQPFRHIEVCPPQGEYVNWTVHIIPPQGGILNTRSGYAASYALALTAAALRAQAEALS